jgi:hypothetical protein
LRDNPLIIKIKTVVFGKTKAGRNKYQILIANLDEISEWQSIWGFTQQEMASFLGFKLRKTQQILTEKKIVLKPSSIKMMQMNGRIKIEVFKKG